MSQRFPRPVQSAINENNERKPLTHVNIDRISLLSLPRTE